MQRLGKKLVLGLEAIMPLKELNVCRSTNAETILTLKGHSFKLASVISHADCFELASVVSHAARLTGTRTALVDPNISS